MKKTVVFILALVLTLCTCVPGLAAGKLNVDTENFVVISGYWSYGYCYAKVSNTGNQPIKINAGVFEIYDEEGNPLTSSGYVNAYPSCLQPGEYAYTKVNSELTEEQLPLVDDYMLTLTGKSDKDTVVTKLPVEVEYQPNVENGWFTYNYLTGTVTNNTDETLFDIRIVMVLLDADGNVLYLAADTLYDGLTPGSGIVFRCDVDSNFLDYYAAQGIEIASCDAIAYIEK